MDAFQDRLRAAESWLSARDPALADIISAAGPCAIVPHTNFYQQLVDAIISQQLSVKAAATIEGRFCELFGSSEFPPAEKILDKSVAELRTAGLSNAKANYVLDLAARVVSGQLKFDQFSSLSNQEIITELVAVKGIGEWTAQMFLMFSLGRLDVLPTGDLGIRNGVQKLYNLEKLPTPIELQALAAAKKWNPYESVASWYIWHSLDNKPAV